MNQTITITPRRLILLGIFGLMSVLTYGFAAANTVPASNAGDGSQAVSGYTVSAVHYGLDLNTPSNIATLTFTVTPGIPATGAVRVSVVTPPSAYWPAAACSFVPGVASSAVTCTPPVGTTVLSIANLRVVAAQ